MTNKETNKNAIMESNNGRIWYTPDRERGIEQQNGESGREVDLEGIQPRGHKSWRGSWCLSGEKRLNVVVARAVVRHAVE